MHLQAQGTLRFLSLITASHRTDLNLHFARALWRRIDTDFLMTERAFFKLTGFAIIFIQIELRTAFRINIQRQPVFRLLSVIQ